MKHATPFSSKFRATGFARALTLAALLAASLLLNARATRAQSQPPRPGNGNRAYNPYQNDFALAWRADGITDPIRLIEIGAVTDDKKNNLIMVVGGREPNDFRRKLLVTHWDGARFAQDSSNDFPGTSLDALIAGHFRPNLKPKVLTTAQNDKGKKPKLLPTSQIVTTEGVYAWNGSGFSRLFSSPPNLRLALTRDGSPDQMIINDGSNAVPYEAGDTDTHPSEFLLNPNEDGFARMAIGAQYYEGGKDFAPDTRFMQAYWRGRFRWMICLLRGRPAPTQDFPNATTGDRLIVYTPKLANRDKPFLKMTRADDFEESWRSDPLPGRVLDIRAGDPKNENKEGILVLTAENNEKERHLYFYAPVQGRIPR